MPKLVAQQPEGKTIRPVIPNVGIQAAYRKKLDRLIAEMQSSLVYWISAAYKANPPEAMAMDASPAKELERVMKNLSRRWLRRFNDASKELATLFASGVFSYSDMRLKKILKDAGFTVDFKMTPAANDAYQAVIAENVGLIKSIPAQYLQQVQGMVMRSVAVGRDLGTLTKEIQKSYGVTKRRAALIARDQNNKATAVIIKARQGELGITKAKWRHSHAGEVPRPSHLNADGKIYEIDKGMYLDGEWVLPGQLINCRCTSEAIIPGLEDE